MNLRATRIFVNGNIVTLDPARPRADAVAVDVDSGRIVAVGSVDDVRVVNGLPECIDLQGQTLLPGFNDCHMHVLPFGLQLEQVDLGPSNVSTIPDVVDRLKAQAPRTSTDGWIRGRGYNHDLLIEQRHPTRLDLDRVSERNPVLISHASGHVVSCNSAALRSCRSR